MTAKSPPPPCICRCPQADHNPAPGLHGCNSCRCFGYRPSAEIAEWYERQDSVDLIEAATCGRCARTIGRGEYRRFDETLVPGDLLVRGPDLELISAAAKPVCMACHHERDFSVEFVRP